MRALFRTLQIHQDRKDGLVVALKFRLSLSFGDFLADIIHIQNFQLLDQFLKSFFGQGARLGENQNLFAKRRHGGNGLNTELGGNNLFGFGITLGEGYTFMLGRRSLKNRAKLFARWLCWF